MDFDGSLSKSFGLPRLPILGENAKFEFRADVFNFFDNLNFNPSSIANNIQFKNFGQAQSVLGARGRLAGSVQFLDLFVFVHTDGAATLFGTPPVS